MIKEVIYCNHLLRNSSKPFFRITCLINVYRESLSRAECNTVSGGPDTNSVEVSTAVVVLGRFRATSQLVTSPEPP